MRPPSFFMQASRPCLTTALCVSSRSIALLSPLHQLVEFGPPPTPPTGICDGLHGLGAKDRIPPNDRRVVSKTHPEIGLEGVILGPVAELAAVGEAERRRLGEIEV